MRRRQLIASLAAGALWPLVARPQARSPRLIGFLSSESPQRFAPQVAAFRAGLADTGYVEGKNVALQYGWAEGRNDRLPALAAELIRQRIEVLAAPGSTPAALAAKGATSSVPVVFFTGGDPVALKLVASLGRPGGNMTGVTSLGGPLGAKRLELVRSLTPAAIAGLVNPSNPALADEETRELEEAARRLGVRLHMLQASREADFAPAFARMAELRVGGLVIGIDSFFTARREALAALALRNRIAAIYQYRDFAAAGGVMSYGANLEEPYRLAGRYTGRILKGEKPADLPVQQIAKVELVVNMKSVGALALSAPRDLLALADEVIQ